MTNYGLFEQYQALGYFKEFEERAIDDAYKWIEYSNQSIKKAYIQIDISKAKIEEWERLQQTRLDQISNNIQGQLLEAVA